MSVSDGGRPPRRPRPRPAARASAQPAPATRWRLAIPFIAALAALAAMTTAWAPAATMANARDRTPLWARRWHGARKTPQPAPTPHWRLTVPFIAALAAMTTAWAPAATANAGVDEMVSRSDIFVGQPNILPRQAMPLGNGRLGVAIWAADGLTLQLNRADTLPARLSPGEVVFDGLKPMIADRSFRGRLDLFNGEWRENGAGMSVQVVVDPQLDRVIVNITGADPNVEQRVTLKLWQPRSPTALVSASDVSLAEHWIDDTQPGASGRPFGSLAGLRVTARDAASEKLDDRTLATTFHAMPDGHYRVIIASPSFDGHQDPTSLLRETLEPPVDIAAAHRWWNDFWARVCLIQATSPDGRADYFETLRTLFLFYSAAQNRGALPGSQAGIADLFSSVRDIHAWDPASFWEWNLRMQVAANLSAGVPELNVPFFALYRNNLEAIHRWTRAKMGGRPGICVPETMRFNGVGVEYGAPVARPFPVVTHACDQAWPAVANAHTYSTGAEVGLWVWETYLKTEDMQFLRANYPLMAEAARFLLALHQRGADDLLHTSPSNAHETQSDVQDPTTDLAAIRALFPATIAAARMLSRDRNLATTLTADLARTPQLPLVDAQSSTTTVPRSATTSEPQLPSANPSPDSHSSPIADAPHTSPGVAGTVSATTVPSAIAPSSGGKIIAPSYNPTAPLVNAENIGLEPVWPYSLISAADPLFETAVRTYEHRPFRDLTTWSADPIQAARLGLGAEMARSLEAITQTYQIYPNGMADLQGSSGEFYIEQMGIASVALSEALVQDNSNIIRIAPAIPPDWTIKGTVYVRGNAQITVTAVDGKPTGFVLAAKSTHTFRIANPWLPGQVLSINAKAGQSYAYAAPGAEATLAGTGGAASESHGARNARTLAATTSDTALPGHVAPTTNATLPTFEAGPPTHPKALGRAAIGLAEPCCAPPPGYNPATDHYPTAPGSN